MALSAICSGYVMFVSTNISVLDGSEGLASRAISHSVNGNQAFDQK